MVGNGERKGKEMGSKEVSKTKIRGEERTERRGLEREGKEKGQDRLGD